MFHISEHYLPYVEGTLIIVVSGSCARVFSAGGRSIEEIEGIEEVKADPAREKQLYAESREDEQEQNHRGILYKKLSHYLADKKPNALILCAPEAYQNEVKEALTKEQQERITQFVPKNLASLPIDAIVRILQEKQA